MNTENVQRFDTLVIGGGIAGLQSAIDLADQGFKVLIVEREPSIGGKMISLSKVFPTLDCSSCICTPKMADAAHHPNITIMTYTEVSHIDREQRYIVSLTKKPRYLDEENCTGCRLCEYACPADTIHEFEGNLGARKAIYVPFSNAIPQVALVDLKSCTLCGACERACPTGCINFMQKEESITVTAETIIVSTGFELSSQVKQVYGGGKFPNVLNALQVERLLAPHGPYGRVLRPSDGMIPDSVAYIQCAGSRDQTLGVPYCSRVCCMYALKQAMLLSGALPMVEITIYYMDIRAFGKGFEQFYQNTKAMGIEFIKAKVGRITEDADHNPIVRIENMESTGQVEEIKHDMIVLSPGILPSPQKEGIIPVSKESDGFIKLLNPKLSSSLTNNDGIFVAGVASGPKDIPDSILDAGAAAMQASNYLHEHRS
jgi:heterodisulfide reductase subunit A2